MLRLMPGVAVRAALAGLRARSVVVIGEAGALPPSLAALVRGARRRGSPVYALEPEALRLRALSDVANEAMPPAGADLDEISRHLARSVGVERGEGAGIEAVSQRLQNALSAPTIRRLAASRITRIDTIGALARRLGNPKTILCLGNGPTSADPALASLPRDALFRVNHQWMGAAFLTRPDVIFAGVKRSMRAAGRTPVGVATRRKERALLAARALEFWHGPLTYAVVEDIAVQILPPVEGPLRPTTGAYMIAAAVALRPERLVVAGMDLFSHPEGAYPGGSVESNAYTPSHDVETDMDFIRRTLTSFGGEILAFSPAFAELARSVPGARFRVIQPRPSPANTA